MLGVEMDGKSALTDFDGSRAEFDAAFGSIPDQALRYLKPGDDYSLGGLLVHVNWVLVHYERVLDGILEGDFAELRPVDPPEELKTLGERTRAGLEPAERRPELEQTDELHQRIKARLTGLGAADWERKAPVFYGPDAAEPYPTSPLDIAGWLSDHYREHVPQIAELVATWKQGS